MDVANLRVVIGASVDALQRDLKLAEQMLDGTAKTADGFGARIAKGLDKAGDKLIGLGTNITALSAPLAGFGIASVMVASDFQSAMNEISARTGIVGADLEAVRQFALKMGADTAFSAQQAADGFLQLLTSGSSVDEAFATLPHVLNLAAAGSIDLGYAADALTDIMKQMGLGVSEAEHVTNVLAKAAGASSAEVDDLVRGFANVGPVARLFGMSVDETAAALAVLSENGIKAESSGTALKSTLLNMVRSSKPAVEALKSAGVSLYDVAGNMRNIDDIIDDLDESLSKMTMKEQIELTSKLGGSYGILGLSSLRASEGIDQMLLAMDGSADAATVAEARMAGFAGASEQLRGAIETLMIQAATPFMENVLTPMIDKITPIVSGFADWAAENPELTSGLFGLSLAGLAVGGALVVLGGALKALWGGIPALAGIAGVALLIDGVNTDNFEKVAVGVGLIGVAAVAAMGPIGALAAGIAGLIAGVVWLEEKTQFLTKGWNAWTQDIPDQVSDLAVNLGMAEPSSTGLTYAQLREAERSGDIRRVQGDAVNFVIPVNPEFKFPGDGTPEGMFRDAIGGLQPVIDLKPIHPKVIFDPLEMRFNEAAPLELPVLTEYAFYNPDGTPFDGVITPEVAATITPVSIPMSQSVIETPLTVTFADSIGTKASVREAFVSLLTGLPISFQAQTTILPIVSDIGRAIDSIRSVLTSQPISATVNAFVSVNPILSGISNVARSISLALGINGSHADGLPYVPFDGYTAILHKGERVLTAEENRAYSGGASVSGGGYGASSGGDIIIESLAVYANTYEGGQRAARGLRETLNEKRRATGMR